VVFWNIRFFPGREFINVVSPVRRSTLPADGVYAFDRLYSNEINDINAREAPLTNTPSTKPALLHVLALALSIGAAASPARAQSAAAEGQKIAFDRGKGNCLTCHEIKGGDLPGTIGPALKDIKSKYPDRNDLVAILTDETKRNPQTVMPPFGRNRILTEQEINAVVDFLQTL
jgi:sulfur-oxidizing protein SoxX